MQKGEYVHRVQTTQSSEEGENLPHTHSKSKFLLKYLVFLLVVMSFYNPHLLLFSRPGRMELRATWSRQKMSNGNSTNEITFKGSFKSKLVYN